MEYFGRQEATPLPLNLVNNRVFGKDDFYSNPNEGVYLRREALKRYFVEYEGMLNREFIQQETKDNTTFRKCFRFQAEKLASSIQNNEPYIPFVQEV